eukprot:TRINITY_DN16996_c0_g2_i1.p1 TRINITY_DN16996_c0_g2~~TRINITY_DN16996_c0_g2_i1.p1  ORF type:complete len:226 (+),score=73.71 TRINITY_DN16996_c0_g2_i1:27-680(+)
MAGSAHLGTGADSMKKEIDFTDPHLIGTLASLAVSVPVFLYFLYQMIANRNDWDVVFDDEGNEYDESDMIQKRLDHLKQARQGKRARRCNDVLEDLPSLESASHAYAHLPDASLSVPRGGKERGGAERSSTDGDDASVESNTPPGSPPMTPPCNNAIRVPDAAVLRQRFSKAAPACQAGHTDNAEPDASHPPSSGKGQLTHTTSPESAPLEEAKKDV